MSRPDYRLVAKRKTVDARGVKVGVAWKTDKGINIKLDPFVVLNGGEEFWLGLFQDNVNFGGHEDSLEESKFSEEYESGARKTTP